MEVILKVIEGLYVEKPQEWVQHRRSKNYIAKITGFSKKYGLERQFLQRQRVGKESYFSIEDFEKGELYEIKCIYYTGSWKPCPRLEGFFECIEKGNKAIILKEISEEELIAKLKQKNSLSYEIAQKEKEKEELAEKQKQLYEKLQKLKKEVEAIKQANKVLEDEIQKINIDEINQLKQKVKDKIIDISKAILDVKGNKKYNKRIYEDENTKIKEENGKISYVLISSVYVISQYNDVSLNLLVEAYQHLKGIYENAKKEIEEEIKEAMP